MSRRQARIAFFGHFGRSNIGGNFGNESTLLAIVRYFRDVLPYADFKCICTGAETVARDYNISAVPSRDAILTTVAPRSSLGRFARKLIAGIPCEVYRWFKGVKTLWGADALVVPGTGLLTDAHTLFNWGPYEMFRWSVTAKMCNCKLLFVSVGAGPIYSRTGRLFVKAALSLADYRSYRDESTLQYLQGIGFRSGNDLVYPDLVFSLPKHLIPRGPNGDKRRRVVGLGVMDYAGKYSVEAPTSAAQSAYLETLVSFVSWLLVHEYNVRLLIGDQVDTPVTQHLKSLLKERSVTQEEGRLIDESVASVDDLLKQLATVDLVVATRYHNVVLALLLNKPVIAISFHHKCSSLMRQMGLPEYCQDINDLQADRLIEQFCNLEENAERLRPLIKEKTEVFRRSLNEQYSFILAKLAPQSDQKHKIGPCEDKTSCDKQKRLGIEHGPSLEQ